MRTIQMKKLQVIYFLLAYWVGIFAVYGQTVPKNFKSLDRLLSQKFDAQFGYSVLVAHQGKVVFRKYGGYAHKRKKQKVNKNTLFNIASITKSVTAVGIFKLIEQGKLHLSDPLSKFFIDVPSDKKAITIAQLLAHRSGFKQNYVCDGVKDAKKALKVILKDKLKFSPGSGFSYSNQNYEMLALIIEKATGQTYEKYTDQAILKPVGMTQTKFWEAGNESAATASTNTRLSARTKRKNWGFIGSGGLYTTAEDLWRFWQGVMGYKIVSRQSVSTMLDNYYKTSSELEVGYGWFTNSTTDWHSKEVWTRGNESWGHNAVVRGFVDKEVVIIVLSNSGEMGDRNQTGNRAVSKEVADWLWSK
ncbi:hypothetical protein BKI52_33770 [marine bacterium AO1-C]|nr:hypothetical protein BKI52_33770 [marine bacterium AO1-C]